MLAGTCYPALSEEPTSRVVALVRDPTRLPKSTVGMQNIEVVPGDLCDPTTYAEALQGCTWVVHLAAKTGKAREARVRTGECRGDLQAPG